MDTKKIIDVHKMQNTPLNEASNKNTWFETLSIKLTRKDLIQVLIEGSHMQGVIPDSRLVAWYELQSWSDLVSLMDCYLQLDTDSYLNTLDYNSY